MQGFSHSLSTPPSPHPPPPHLPLHTSSPHLPPHTHTLFHRGNCILVGSLGQPLEPLVRFALYLAGYSLQPLDTRETAAFNDGLRTLLRQTGLEGKPTAIIVEVRCVLMHTAETHDVVVLPANFSKVSMNGCCHQDTSRRGRISVTNLSSENNLPMFQLNAPVVIRYPSSLFM